MIRERLIEIVSVVFEGNAYAAAQAADVEPSTLHRILESKVEAPRLSTIQRLAAAYGVPVGWLVGELSEEQAQQLTVPTLIPDADLPLAVPFWLIYAYHRTRQAALRERMRNVASEDRETRLIIAELCDFRFLPTSDDFPIPGLRMLLAQSGDVTDADIRMVRTCAEFETQSLIYTVQMLGGKASRRLKGRKLIR